MLANHAEAMILAGREIVSEEVRGPLEQTLVLQADHPKALWYGGIAAREAGEPNLAIERWQRLKSLSPPEELLRVLDQEIAATYQAMGVEPPAVVADAPIETLRFDIGISLSPAITTDGEFAALFVLLRRAGGGGPPIAARRLPVDLPVEIVIGPEHAMIAGTSFEDLGSLVLVARLSRSGNAIAASGDLEGRVDIDPGSRVPITVMIDAVVP